MVRRIVPPASMRREITLGALEAMRETLPAVLRNVTGADARIQGQAADSWAIVEVVSPPGGSSSRSSAPCEPPIPAFCEG